MDGSVASVRASGSDLPPLRRVTAPYREAWQLSRPVLIAEIAGAIKTHRVVVLHALHGYGKTRVLADVARSVPGHHIWLTLAVADRNAATLISEMTYAVAGHQSESVVLDRSAGAEQRTDIADVIRLANMIARRHGECLVILDDLQALEGASQALSMIGHLIRFTPDSVRFLIGTRWWNDGKELSIGITTHTVRNHDALAFTVSEIEDALDDTMIPTAYWGALAQICRAAHGWPASIGEALRLLHHSDMIPPDRLGAYVEAACADAAALVANREVVESAETMEVLPVLSQLEFGHLDLLRQLSTPASLERTLQWLQSHGIVTSSDDRNGRLRVNPLVRTRLLGLESTALLSPMQHNIAADWCAEHGDAVSEVRHRLHAADPNVSAALIENAIAVLSSQGAVATVLDLVTRFQALTGSTLNETLVMRKAIAAQQLGLSRDVIELMSDVIDRCAGEENHVAQWYFRRGVAHRNIGALDTAFDDLQFALHSCAMNDRTYVRCLNVRATLHASQLQTHAAERDFIEGITVAMQLDEHDARAVILADFGHFLLIEGRLDDAFQRLSECMAGADAGLLFQSMAMSRNGLGLVRQAKGDLATAEVLFGEAMLIARGGGRRIVESLLWLSLADLAVERGHAEDGRRMYRRALAIATIVEQPGYMSYALSGLAGIERMAGRFEEAGRLLVEARQHLGPELRYDRAVLALRKAHLHIDEGNYGLAFEELNPTIEALRNGHARMDLARGLLLRADADFMAYGIEASFPDLAEILSLVDEVGTSQFLAPYCRRMPRLLRALAVSPRGAGWAAIIGLGADLAPERRNGHVTPIARVDDPDPSLLNARELEVVLALCDGLSREEVAARVGRSLSTVHKLIHGIYTATGFHATHQIVAWAFRRGLYRPGRAND